MWSWCIRVRLSPDGDYVTILFFLLLLRLFFLFPIFPFISYAHLNVSTYISVYFYPCTHRTVDVTYPRIFVDADHSCAVCVCYCDTAALLFGVGAIQFRLFLVCPSTAQLLLLFAQYHSRFLYISAKFIHADELCHFSNPMFLSTWIIMFPKSVCECADDIWLVSAAFYFRWKNGRRWM